MPLFLGCKQCNIFCILVVDTKCWLNYVQLETTNLRRTFTLPCCNVDCSGVAFSEGVGQKKWSVNNGRAGVNVENLPRATVDELVEISRCRSVS